MKKIIAMGEGLIDFIPMQTGCEIKDVESFSGRVGGAPCNVAAMAAKLGGNSAMISMLGKDGFGDKIVETLNSVGVDTTAVLRTDKANTALALYRYRKTETGNSPFTASRVQICSCQLMISMKNGSAMQEYSTFARSHLFRHQCVKHI